MVIFSLLTALFFLVLLIDLYPRFKNRQSRIKIGQFSDEKRWKASVAKKTLQWLRETPTVKLSDNNRLIVLDILRGKYKHDAIQLWQEAALVLGLTAEYSQTKNETTKNEVESYINRKIKFDGNWAKPITESDGIILGYAFIQTSFIDHQRLRPAYDSLWCLIKELKGTHLTMTYKRHTQTFRYVDTIGFTCPFLIEYGQKFFVHEAIDLAIAQIEDFNVFGMYPNQFIPCHTYSITTKLPVGLFGWGRGLGWYAIGLIDVWKALDFPHPKKQEITQWVEKFARMAMKFQRKNGSWGWLVMNENSQADSSATATLAWFLANASQITTIENECNKSAEKALQYLMSVTRKDGAVDYSQGDTMDIGVHSREFDVLPFTQGFTLRTISIFNY